MVVTLLLFIHSGCVFIMWYIVLCCGYCPVALSAVSLRWSLCCCLFIVGVCLLCGTLSCGVVLAQWPCLLSVYGGHSVVVYSLWVCVYYVVHCLVVWLLPSGLVSCQFMVVTLLLFIHCGCVFIMWYIVLWCGYCPVALSPVSLRWSLCCCLFIVGVCLLCGTLSCGVVLAQWPCLLSVCGGHSVVVYSLWVCLLCVTSSFGVSLPQWPCLLSVHGGHSVFVYSLWVCVYYVVHCLVVCPRPSGLVCCQFMVVTLLLFTHCGCVFIMWYIVLWCGSCPVALSAVSLWWSLCCCLFIVGVFIMCYIVLWCVPAPMALSAVSSWWSLCFCLLIVGVCLLCGTLSSGVVLVQWPCLLSVYGGHSVVVNSLWVCFYYMVVTLLLLTHCGCVFIM